LARIFSFSVSSTEGAGALFFFSYCFSSRFLAKPAALIFFYFD